MTAALERARASSNLPALDGQGGSMWRSRTRFNPSKDVARVSSPGQLSPL